MTIDQTICQPKLCMKRDGNAQSSIDVNKYGAHLMPLNHTFNLEYPLRFFTRSIFFSRLFPDFFLDFFPDSFLDFFLDNFFNFFPTFSSTFFMTLFSTFFPNFFPNFFPTLFPEFFPGFSPGFFSDFLWRVADPNLVTAVDLANTALHIVVKTRNFFCSRTPKWSALPPCFWFWHLL